MQNSEYRKEIVQNSKLRSEAELCRLSWLILAKKPQMRKVNVLIFNEEHYLAAFCSTMAATQNRNATANCVSPRGRYGAIVAATVTIDYIVFKYLLLLHSISFFS